jgi:hypothetical protein
VMHVLAFGRFWSRRHLPEPGGERLFAFLLTGRHGGPSNQKRNSVGGTIQ